MAHWLIQTNTGFADDYNGLADSLRAENASWSRVSMRPFTRNVQGLPPDYKHRPCTLWGSVNLIRWGKEKGLPGVWWNERFSFETQRIIYGTEMLNWEAEVCRFGSVPSYEGDRFIRPVDDGKAFTGEVIGYYNLAAWQERIQDLNSEQVAPSTQVLVAPVRRIFREYRFFVVGGAVVTGSLYQEDGRVTRRALDDKDAYVREYAQQMVTKWCPDKAFVIDVAILDGSYMPKIVEFNNINACGLYEADVRALVRAIDALLPGS